MSATAMDRPEGARGAPPAPVEVAVNGEARTFGPGATVASVLAHLLPSPRGCAVALNGEVVPRSGWAETLLSTGDQLEVVGVAAGG